MPSPTRSAFLDAYRAAMVNAYAWCTSQPDRFARFLDGVRESITTDRTPWNAEGDALRVAWRAVGGTGKPSLKALRELPDGSPSNAPAQPEPTADASPDAARTRPATAPDSSTPPFVPFRSVTIRRADLLATLRPFTQSRAVYLVASADGLSVRDCYTDQTSPPAVAEVGTPGWIALDRFDAAGRLSTFVEILRLSPDDVLALSVEGGQLHVRGCDAHYKLNATSPESLATYARKHARKPAKPKPAPLAQFVARALELLRGSIDDDAKGDEFDQLMRTVGKRPSYLRGIARAVMSDVPLVDALARKLSPAKVLAWFERCGAALDERIRARLTPADESTARDPQPGQIQPPAVAAPPEVEPQPEPAPIDVKPLERERVRPALAPIAAPARVTFTPEALDAAALARYAPLVDALEHVPAVVPLLECLQAHARAQSRPLGTFPELSPLSPYRRSDPLASMLVELFYRLGWTNGQCPAERRRLPQDRDVSALKRELMRALQARAIACAA